MTWGELLGGLLPALVEGLLHYGELLLMARKKGKTVEDGNKRKWNGYFNYSLTKADKTAVRELADDSERIRPSLSELVERGYRVSISISDSDGVATVTATGQGEGHANAGYSLSMRHIDYEIALLALWHVIAQKFQWASWQQSEEALDEFSW